MLENIGVSETYIKIRSLPQDIIGFYYKIHCDKSEVGQIEFHPVTDTMQDAKGVIRVQYRSTKESRCSFIPIPSFMTKILTSSIVGKAFINPDGVIVIEVMHMLGIPDHYRLSLKINGSFDSSKDHRSRIRKPRFRNFLLIIPMEIIGSPDPIYGEFIKADSDEIEIRISRQLPQTNPISFIYDKVDAQFRSVKMVSTIRFSVFKTNKTRPPMYKFESFEDNVLKFRRPKNP